MLTLNKPISGELSHSPHLQPPGYFLYHLLESVLKYKCTTLLQFWTCSSNFSFGSSQKTNKGHWGEDLELATSVCTLRIQILQNADV